jgi:hypothetical protein
LASFFKANLDEAVDECGPQQEAVLSKIRTLESKCYEILFSAVHFTATHIARDAFPDSL